MKVIDVLCAVVVMLGGINWGAIGAFGFNPIEYLSGNMLAERMMYIFIGMASLHQAFNWRKIQNRWKIPQTSLSEDPIL